MEDQRRHQISLLNKIDLIRSKTHMYIENSCEMCEDLPDKKHN